MKYPIVIALLSLGCWAQAQQPQWRYRELPSIPGLELSATGINENGQMAIQAYRPSDFTYGVGRYSLRHGYQLGALNVSHDYFASGITRSGKVYGRVNLTDSTVPTSAVYTWDYYFGYNQYTPAWSTIGEFGSLEAVGCSDSGIIVSNQAVRNNTYVTKVHYPDHIEVAMNDGNLATAMNASGLFVGQWFSPNAFSSTLPFISDPIARTVTTLQSPGQLFGGAHAINNSGQIFGIVSKQGSAPGWYGTWWSHGGSVLRQTKLYDIGFNERQDPHNNGGSGVNMNENGEVVFDFRPSGTSTLRPKFYAPLTGVVDIRDNIIGIPSGKYLPTITGLTNSRYMTGILQDETGWGYSNFYLEPVPEPATFAALGIGLAAMLRRKKQVY